MNEERQKKDKNKEAKIGRKRPRRTYTMEERIKRENEIGKMQRERDKDKKKE
jgi:hypothetical protein